MADEEPHMLTLTLLHLRHLCLYLLPYLYWRDHLHLLLLWRFLKCTIITGSEISRIPLIPSGLVTVRPALLSHKHCVSLMWFVIFLPRLAE
ncbi:hypothetical protein F2Q70_00004624 [Brassica cretica]|uniref:Uncharacterized protein n=1 Tax=Brassica cretica TaxID=69181 RepID=A0A3N6RZB0_BRACR|nr:hypothetical protein F2Q70_00004624 [Brassica cretica]KAF3561889.1 hypothetical protein DY000_02016726 [Brassica cretica]